MAPGSVHFPALFSQSRQRTRRSTDARDDPSEFETIGEKGENARGMRDRHTPKKNLLPELTVALNVSFSPSLSPSLSRSLYPLPPPKSETNHTNYNLFFLSSCSSSSSLLGRGSGAPLLGEGAAAPRRRCPSLSAPAPLLLPLLSLRPAPLRRLTSFPAPAAKKGGGGAQKKPPSLIPKGEKPPYAAVDAVMLTLLLVESYRRALGKPLIGGSGDDEGGGLEISAAPRALYEFPFAVLAHDRFSCAEGEQPRFTYANLAAQKVFEAPWGELVGMESRRSAEPDDEAAQADRERLLERAAATGEAQKNYRGWRVSARGTRFEIQDGVLFNVKSPSGEDIGQAVVFGHWKFEDGSEGGPSAPPPAASGDSAAASPSFSSDAAAGGGAPPPPPPPSLEAAEAAVAEQAAAVRALKDSGKGNGDLEVSAAVGELLRLKGVVAGIKGKE